MTFLKCLNGRRERNNIFSNPLYASETCKNWPRAKRNPQKNLKNICEVILNTPNVADSKVPSCTVEYCTLQNGQGTTQSCQSVPKHSMGTMPPPALFRLCRDQPPPPRRWRALKKPQNPHPWDLVMSLGFGNQANEESRAKISNFCQVPGKAHCYQ